jgi:ferredoxin, 2Fe-2S
VPAVTYVGSDGERDEVELEPGTTVKDGALENGVESIVAECGGNAMCATCHVYVDEPWRERLPERSDVEDELLDSTACERTDASRLSCQIRMTDELDGLVVHLPEEQE